MKRICLIIVSVIMVSVIMVFNLMSCKSNNNTINNIQLLTERQKENNVSEKSELTGIGWDDTVNGHVAGYISEDKSITFKTVSWDKELDELLTRLQFDENIDYAQIDINWLSPILNTNKLQDLNEILGKEWLENNIDENLLKNGQVNGKQVSVPIIAASIAMICNPTILKNAGINENPKTIEEFEMVLGRIKQNNPQIIPYGFLTKGASSVAKDYLAWIWTFGGHIFDSSGNPDINNKGTIKATKWLKSLFDKGYIKLGLGRSDVRLEFSKNNVAFYDDAISAKGMAVPKDASKEEIDSMIEPILRPVVNVGDKPQSVLWGNDLVILTDNKKQKEAAGEFLKYILSDEAALDNFNKTGSTPSTKSGLNIDIIKSDNFTNEWNKITKTATKSELAHFQNCGELEQIVYDTLISAISGETSVEDALANAQIELEKVTKS